MKTKNTIKLLNSITSIFKLAIELEQKQIEKRLITPVPDYSKGKVNNGGLMMVVDSKGSNYKEKFLTPEQLDKIYSMPRNTAGGGNYPRTKLSDVFSHQEHWSKQLNEYLKQKGLNDSQPFGFAPIEEKYKCPKCNSNDILTVRERCSNGVHVQSYNQCGNCKHKFIDEGFKYFIVDEKGKKTEINKPLDFNLNYDKYSVDNFQKGMLEADKELQKVCHEYSINMLQEETPFDWIKFTNNEFSKKKECPHENIDIERYGYSFNAETVVVQICADCGLNLSLDRMHKKKEIQKELRNRQLEIGKEIEKLRNEARTIKNQLKDSK